MDLDLKVEYDTELKLYESDNALSSFLLQVMIVNVNIISAFTQ